MAIIHHSLKDEESLAVQQKNIDYFLEKGIPFPQSWYGRKPQVKDKPLTYSRVMRELSDMSLEELEVIEMFWGIEKFNRKKIMFVEDEFVQDIPAPTPTLINALTQIKLSIIDSDERKEWADRTEGKVVSREITLGLNNSEEKEEENDIKQLILSKFDDFDGVFSNYGKDSHNEDEFSLDLTKKADLPAPESLDNGDS